jgi:hypothetical protein
LLRVPLFIAQFSKYEYWPWWLFYLPVLPYWLYLGIKNRSLAYFTVANPGIELGGFYGESKTEILGLIDPQYLPKALSVNVNDAFEFVVHRLKSQNLSYPVIAKPDVGERGNQVALIDSENELKEYHKRTNKKYIIQEYILYPIELGVLYSIMPGAKKGKVSSITRKEFLSVTGDGKSTIKQLLQNNLRARFQIKRLEAELGESFFEILRANEVKVLEPIGNHCRGTKFIDNNFLINEKLNAVFDEICAPIKGFNYGRFDLKVNSIEDLYDGKNIRILELNGASSEPGHIYDPSLNLYQAYRDLLYHWKLLAEVSQKNIQLGLKPVSFWLIIKSYWKFIVLKK